MFGEGRVELKDDEITVDSVHFQHGHNFDLFNAIDPRNPKNPPMGKKTFGNERIFSSLKHQIFRVFCDSRGCGY